MNTTTTGIVSRMILTEEAYRAKLLTLKLQAPPFAVKSNDREPEGWPAYFGLIVSHRINHGDMKAFDALADEKEIVVVGLADGIGTISKYIWTGSGADFVRDWIAD